MSFGNSLREDLLDEVFGAQNYTAPTALEFGLSTTAPNDDGTNITEPDGVDGYARVTEDNDLVTWNVAVTQDGATAEGITIKENAIEITFPEATATWGTVTHFIIADDAGVFMGWGELVIPKTIEQGDTARFAVEDLEIRLL